MAGSKKKKVAKRIFWLKKKDNLKFLLGLILAVAILAAAFLLYKSFAWPSQWNTATPSNNLNQNINVSDNKPDENMEANMLNGIYVEKGQENLLPYAVMIENHFEVWPQSGLESASVVYEALVEGGISRFLAIYDSLTEIEEIGPVRSARPYYLDWAEEYKALYLHVGGSPEALRLIPYYDINDLNEYYNGQYFWRSKYRSRPHNVYTSSELVTKVLENKELENSGNFKAWYFVDEESLENRGEDGQTISFNYSHSDTYRVDWIYNQAKNAYLRYQGGQKHLQKGDKEIWATNVIVQYMDMKVLDYIGRKKFTTVDNNKAIIFQDGLIKIGTWEKADSEARTRFYYPDGTEARFNRGPLWIEIIPTGYDVKY